MFRAPNPFEELVNKATDENLTTENWELNLELCDRLASNDESDARKCMAVSYTHLTLPTIYSV